MRANQKSNARDSVKTADFFKGVISETKAAIDSEVKTGLATVMLPVPRRCRQIALAHYSANDAIPECVRWFGKATTYKIEYFEKMNYRLGGYGDLMDNLEMLSAASLAGRGAELVDAYRRCQLQSVPVPRARGLINQAFAVFKDEPVRQEKAEMDDLKKNGKDLATLAPLFKAVSDRDATSFAKALDDFLSISWARQVKGIERFPQYSGKWSILSAAVCKLLGGVPELSGKTGVYIPAELVSAK